MKHKTILQRIAAFALAVLTAFSMLPAATAYAAGEAGTVTFTYCYDSDGNMILYNGETNVDGYTAGGAGHPKPRMFVDGETAYCIQPGRHLLVNDTLYKSSSAAWNALSAGQRKAIGLALLYGYQGNWSNLSGSDDEKWVATAEIIWEYVTGCRESTPPYRQVSTAIYDIQFGSNQPNYGTKAVYDTIIALMQRHSTIPSFLSTSADVASKDLEYKDGTYSLTLTDSNGVLSEFNFSSSSRAVSVTKSGNTLTISATEPFQDVVRITASRNNIPTVSSSAKIIAYGDVDLQDVVTGVENADPVYGYLNVETPTGNIDLKKTSEDGVVAGIRFTISGEKMEQTVTTTEDGSIFVEGLVPGVYTVTEQSIDRYLPQDVQRVTVIGGRTTTVTFNNVLKRGDLVVTKTSEDGMVEGIKFHLYGTSLSGLAVDEYAITDGSGKATFKDVLIGTGYMLEEVDTVVKYVIPASQKAAVEWNKVTEKNFSNILKKWNATVTKSDRSTGAAQGDATLAGAIYGVYKGDALVDSYTTDVNGQFTTDYYVCGDDWSIREISPSEGYLLDSTAYHVGAEATLYTVEYNSTANDVTEDIVKGNIAIIKHTDDGETQIETPEVGATFAVYLKAAGGYDAARDSERDFLTCDENGFAQTKDLPYGIYTVEQVSGWDGRELMPAFDVYVAEHGQTYRYLINNAYFQSYIKVIKVDAETGNPIPYAGAGFQLYRPDGSLITQTFTYPEVTTIDTFYTNDEGYLITPEKLEYGTGYKLIEVSSPYGYVLSSEPVYFDVTADEASEDNAVTVVEVTKANMAQKGIIKVSKSGEVFATVTSKGFYQPIYEVRGLPGAVYEIRAAEDVVTLDGTLRFSAGDVVDTITTGEDGEAVSQPLYLGKYEITEITAPYGMVLNTEVRAVELVYAGQEVEITETSASFNNERQKAQVTLNKTLLADEKFGIGLHGEVATVTFGMYAAEELTAADGSTIPADGLMEIVSVNTSGTAAIRTDLPADGKYYLKELSTDEHYLLSDQKYPIVFDYAGGEIAVVDIQANDGNAIRNEIIYGEIHGLKKDDAGNVLPGALIGLFKPDVTEFTEASAIMTAPSAEDGSFSFAKVPYGTWIVHEISAPAGYVLSDKSYEAIIAEGGAVVELEVVNALICGTVQLTKVDKDYPENKLTGAEFEVYKDSNGDQKWDKDDEKLGKMPEVSVGVYEMGDLPYGGYFVREVKAPEGFYLDENAYYFSITENGKTVVVENEAGKNFINVPQTGALKIFKTSSDKKIEGFSFRVSGPNGYEQVFTTDKNGEIFIEGLRCGDYRVSEVQDKVSEPYVLATDKIVTISAGAEVKIEMHNELRDTPKTGDDRNPTLWYALTGAGFIGAATCTLLAVKKKKKGGRK